MHNYTRRCWAEIDLDALQSNMRLIESKLTGEKVMAVVKADGYGCGAGMIAKTLSEQFGVCHWAVANIDEAIKLREQQVQGEILILGYTPPQQASCLARLQLTQSLISPDYADALADQAHKAGVHIQAHIAIDTGMNRIGFLPKSNLKQTAAWDAISITGAFTHLCHADSGERSAREFTQQQILRFEQAASGFTGLHCKNSAAILTGAGAGFSYARPGIILYGLQPSEQITDQKLKPVMSWKAVVSMVKTIPAGETVGYSRTFLARRQTQVATIPVGYADGYSRMLSNRGKVMIHGKPAPIIGNVCMDQLMLDVTGWEVKPGEEVVLFGDGYTADDMAKDLGTIGYEVMCNVSKRVPRVYLQAGKEISVQSWI